MSLGKTLLKVAIGVAIVKGVTSLTQGGTAGADPASGRTAGRGTPFDPKSAGKPGGLEDLLKDVLGSGSTSKATTSRPSGGDGGGLGDLLTQMSGQKRTNPRATAPKGGLEDLLGQLSGSGRAAPTQTASGRGAAPGGVGDLLDQVLADRRPGGPVALPEPKREEELSAALMLRA
ncbi:MAG: hypothetical protein ACK4NE_05760, partial [Albidovulum sp.]